MLEQVMLGLALLHTLTVLAVQEFTPWSNIRSGGIKETTLNYTGQRRDSS